MLLNKFMVIEIFIFDICFKIAFSKFEIGLNTKREVNKIQKFEYKIY